MTGTGGRVPVSRFSIRSRSATVLMLASCWSAPGSMWSRSTRPPRRGTVPTRLWPGSAFLCLAEYQRARHCAGPEEDPGQEVLVSLVRLADVLPGSFAPGAMDRPGADTLHGTSLRLIHASGTGFGLPGPDRYKLAMHPDHSGNWRSDAHQRSDRRLALEGRCVDFRVSDRQTCG